ncbi:MULTISPECIES: hypothetical protein [Clostridium]|uniref:hypothetical protein n=1 Tax=Clostridium TaxID=1485 RepID=UPI0011118831|nr:MULTISPECIES: hypothetical protein [Clostridium]
MSNNKLCKRKHLRIEDCLIIEYRLDQNRKSCTKTNLCNSNCGKQCKKCKLISCYRTCNEYSIKKCSKTNLYLHICNS